MWKRSRYSCPSFGLCKMRYTWTTDPECPQALWKGTVSFAWLILSQRLRLSKAAIYCLHWICKWKHLVHAVTWSMSCKEFGKSLGFFCKVGVAGHTIKGWATWIEKLVSVHFIISPNIIIEPIDSCAGRNRPCENHPQFPVPAVTGRQKACENNCLSYPP